jgi:hypothetical protein
MLFRIAFLATLICVLNLPLYSEPMSLNGCRGSHKQHSPAEPGVCKPELPAREAEGVFVLPPSVDDIRVGRGPNTNARALQLIAIYASIGNREGVEILAAQLRTQGVSAETINEVMTWAKLHSTLQGERRIDENQQQSAPPLEGGETQANNLH